MARVVPLLRVPTLLQRPPGQLQRPPGQLQRPPPVYNSISIGIEEPCDKIVEGIAANIMIPQKMYLLKHRHEGNLHL